MKENKELVLYHSGFGGNPNLEPLKLVAKLFEEKYPDVRVRVHYQNRFDQPETVEEINPDIFFLVHGDFKYFHDKGITANLIPLLKNKDINPASYVHYKMIELLTVEEELMAIPVLINLFGVAYNKTHFDNAGLDYPKEGWTWEQFLNMSLKLKAVNQDIQPAKLILHLDLLENLIMSLGGSYLSPDGMRATGYLNSQPCVEAIRWVVDYSRKYQLSTHTGESLEISVEEFNAGKVSMTVNRHEDLRKISDQMMEQTGFVGMPHFENGVQSIPPILYGFGISKHTKHPELAFELLSDLTLEYNAFIQDESGRGQIVALDNIEDRLGVKDKALRQALKTDFSHLHSGAYLANKNWFGGIWTHMLNKLIKEDVSVQEVLNDIAKDVDRHLLKYSK
ncbi:extracellular solute-binding protein [Paenibacillus tarimensis]